MKKKRNIVIIVVCLVVLAAAAAVLAYLNAPKGEIESGTLTVVSGGSTLRSYSMEQIKALDYIEVQKKIISSSYANDEGLFRGVPLRALLESAGGELLESASQIVVRSEDGYVAAYAIDEVLESDNIFIAYSKDGESLGNKDNGGVGPFRVIITDDEFGTRCAKYIYEIEIK